MWGTWISGTQVEQGRLELAGLGYWSSPARPRAFSHPTSVLLVLFTTAHLKMGFCMVVLPGSPREAHLALVQACKKVSALLSSYFRLLQRFPCPNKCVDLRGPSPLVSARYSSMGISAGWSQLARVGALSFHRAQARINHTEKRPSGQNITLC